VPLVSRTPAPPRIAPVGALDRTADQAELLQGTLAGLGASNIFATLVRAPGLFRRWLPFGGKLLAGKLPARDRELLILRTAWHCRADYEWGHHVAIGLQAGLTRQEIDRIPAGPDAGWGAADAVLLRAADELHGEHRVADATWAALAERYDTQQLIELPMLVGHYHLVAMTLNTLGVQLEEGFEGLPA
jgi:alkylhydroperoxidase family enzyme